MADPPPPKSVPPGWYADPEMADTQRYWDGAAWTEHRAPGSPASEKGISTDSLETAGWISAIFFPAIGFIIGLVLTGRDDTQGWWIVLTSLLCSAVIVGAFLLAASS